MAHNPHEKYKLAAELGDLLPESPEEQTGPQSPPALPENLEELCRLHICTACTVQAEAEDVRLRAMAELENVKKRLRREQEESLRFAAEAVLGDLLPSLDTLDRALEYGNGEACREVIQGVEMTRKLMFDALKRHGLESCGESGEPFDPEFHEAIGFALREELDDNAVAAVAQRGYLLRGRLLRPAKVLINKKS